MVKFMAFVNNDGKITGVNWCQPEMLLAEGDSLPELFAEESKNSIYKMLQNIFEKESKDSIITQLCLESRIVPVTLFGLTLYGQGIVLGFDSGATDFELCQGYINIYNDFVNDMRKEFSRAIKQRELSINQQFEEIQKLNNDLINTRRQLEKANVLLQNRYEELQKKVVRDALTGLVSRHQYWAELEGIISKHPAKYGVFTFIDIDDFKFINDTFGHAAGDKFLVEFARRLQKMPLPDTVKIRIAGDEFALFTYGLDTVDHAFLDYIWSSIRTHVISDPIDVFDFSVPVSISAGMSVYGLDTERLNELIEYADFAMYQAKSRGKNCFQRFDREEYISHTTPDTQVLELRNIIEGKDLFHVYQPVIEAADGSVYGYAILLRTENTHFKDTRELLQAAVKKGMYAELNNASLEILKDVYFRLENILGEKNLFITQGPYPLYRQEMIKKIPQHTSFKNLVLEVTESSKAAMSDLEQICNYAGENGYRLVFGHFGTGYANDLMILAAGPHFIKLDMDLVRDIHNDTARQRMLKTAVQFAHRLSIQVVAEGIEKREEMETLVQLGADYLQGYYIGEPAKEPGAINNSVSEEIIKANRAGENESK